MQIALTKKLTDALVSNRLIQTKRKPAFLLDGKLDNVWITAKPTICLYGKQRHAFIVAVYQFKRKDLKNKRTHSEAIVNTLLSLNLNPEIVEDYLLQAGDLKFTANRNRQPPRGLKAGLDVCLYIGDRFNGSARCTATPSAPRETTRRSTTAGKTAWHSTHTRRCSKRLQSSRKSRRTNTERLS